MLSASERARFRWEARSMDDELISAFEQYQRSQRLAPTTIRNRESILRTLVKRTGVALMEQTPNGLRSHLAREDVSAGTARTERNAIKTFYGYLIFDGYLDKDPPERLPAVHTPKGEPRPFTREQIIALFAAAGRKRILAMLMLGYYQGFRVSQIARVHGADIDMLTRTIRTVAKGSKDRRLPMHEQIADLATSMPTNDWWFPSPTNEGQPIQGHAVTDRITIVKKRAGITDTKLTPHSLRHSFATDLVDEGVDIRTIQELMLHEDLSTTQIYTKVSAQRKADAIGMLRRIDTPDSPALRLVA